jgi:peptide-methionine (S)-S-oxide reductase
MSDGPITQVATLGGGCFWCLEAVFDEVEGVVSVESGYSGGKVIQPNYQQVCTGKTGHAEVVQVTFDTEKISYREILEIFFTIHNPTTLDRQGADVGPQYRSVIFYHDLEQKATAEHVMHEIGASGIWDDPLVTQLLPGEVFYMAEDYHQEYFKKNPFQGYCQVVVAPKVAKFRQKFTNKLKSYS